MNRHLSDLPGEGEQRDPVADFFARERAEIRELPAGTDRWESIVVEGRRPVRQGWLPYLAGAAAVVMVGGVAWGVSRGPGTDQATAPASSTALVSTVTVTATSGPKVAPSSSTNAPSSSPSTSTTPSTLPVPTSFNIVSMTNSGGGHLFALGSATCPTGECTAVIESTDDGASWSTLASFTTLTSPGARATPRGPQEVVGIRFANDRVGYIFGSATLRTVDGGHTWEPLGVDGRTVLSLETDGTQVWMVTTTGCPHGATALGRGCTDLQVRNAPIGSRTTAPLTYALPGEAENAWIALDGSDAYLNQSSAGSSAARPAIRLSGKPAALPVPKGCVSGMWVSATANTRGSLVGVCRSAGAPDSQYLLAVSGDRGSTWATTPAPGLGAPSGTGVWLTATDPTHLVAVRQALPSNAALGAPTAVLTSRDGGKSWQDATVTPAGATDWVGAAGGPLVYALAGGRSYWVSHDSGATFDSLPLRR